MDVREFRSHLFTDGPYGLAPSSTGPGSAGRTDFPRTAPRSGAKLQELACLLASKPDHQLLGQTEFIGTDAAEAQHQQWAHRLKHEGGEAILEELRGLTLPKRNSLREVWRATIAYFENHVHRMDYPSYRARGWHIGSGPVEAACNRVIGQRLKGTGMRWGPAGADAMSHLRALLLSERGQWPTYWAHRPRAA